MIELSFQTERKDIGHGVTTLLTNIESGGVSTVQIWINTGSASETDDNSGVAHLIEHLLFRGPANNLNQEFEKIGGSLNAYTAIDHTVYYVTVPTEHLWQGFTMLANMFLDIEIDAAGLELEKQIVIQELAEEGDNTGEILINELFKLAFEPGKSNYGRSIIGTRSSLESIDLNKIRQFLDENYTSQRMMVSAAGDFNASEFAQHVKKVFSGRHYVDKKRRSPSGETVRSAKRSTIETGEFEHLAAFAWKIPLLRHADSFAIELLAELLGGGVHSLLHERLCLQTQIARDVAAHCFSSLDAGLMILQVDLNGPGNLALLEKELKECFDKLLTGDDLDSKLSLAVQASCRDTLFDYQTSEDFAYNLAFHQTMAADHTWSQNYVNRITNLTKEQFINISKKYLKAPLATVYVCPKYQERSLEKANQDETIKQPSTDLKSNINVNAFKNTSKIADSIHFVSAGLNVCSIQVSFQGGLSLERAATRGSGFLLTSTIGKLTSNYDEQQLLERLINCKAHYEAVVAKDSFWIRMDAPYENILAATELLLEMTFDTVFRDSIFSREQQFVLADLEAEKRPS